MTFCRKVVSISVQLGIIKMLGGGGGVLERIKPDVPKRSDKILSCL